MRVIAGDNFTRENIFCWDFKTCNKGRKLDHAFPTEPHFAPSVAESEKEVFFTQLAHCVGPTFIFIWPKKHLTGWSANLLLLLVLSVTLVYLNSLDYA